MLPDYPVVIKTNHDSGTVFIIKDKASVDFRSIREALKMSLRHNYYHSSREWQYKNIERKIIIEKLLTDESGGIPKDFKVFCFDGEPEFIQVDSDRFDTHRRTLYDLEWQQLPFEFKYPAQSGIEKPIHLQEMLKLARKLAKPFAFSRVDFYDVGNALYFGEITFHPESGFGNFIPEYWDEYYGEKLMLKKSASYDV